LGVSVDLIEAAALREGDDDILSEAVEV